MNQDFRFLNPPRHDRSLLPPVIRFSGFVLALGPGRAYCSSVTASYQVRNGVGELTYRVSNEGPRLNLQTGAADTTVRLPEAAGSTTVSAKGGVSDLTFEVPRGVAADIRLSGGMTAVKSDKPASARWATRTSFRRTSKPPPIASCWTSSWALPRSRSAETTAYNFDGQPSGIARVVAAEQDPDSGAHAAISSASICTGTTRSATATRARQPTATQTPVALLGLNRLTNQPTRPNSAKHPRNLAHPCLSGARDLHHDGDIAGLMATNGPCRNCSHASPSIHPWAASRTLITASTAVASFGPRRWRDPPTRSLSDQHHFDMPPSTPATWSGNASSAPRTSAPATAAICASTVIAARCEAVNAADFSRSTVRSTCAEPS